MPSSDRAAPVTARQPGPPAAERLIVVTGPRSEESLARVRMLYNVTQTVSKRVFLARGGGDPEPEGVLSFSGAEVPREILKALDDREALFVAAWRAQRVDRRVARRRGAFSNPEVSLKSRFDSNAK
jgi:hypothetical protein